MSNAGGVSTLTRYTDMLAGNTAWVDPAYESISTVTVGAGGAANVTFSSIPATYQHLQIRYLGRTSQTSYESDGFNILINNNGTPASTAHSLIGDGANASSNGSTSANGSLYFVGSMPGSTINASMFGAGVVDILDYTNTNKNVVYRSLSGYDANSTSAVAHILFKSGLWVNLGPITSLQFAGISGGFSQYTQFALYGIKG